MEFLEGGSGGRAGRRLRRWRRWDRRRLDLEPAADDGLDQDHVRDRRDRRLRQRDRQRRALRHGLGAGEHRGQAGHGEPAQGRRSHSPDGRGRCAGRRPREVDLAGPPDPGRRAGRRHCRGHADDRRAGDHGRQRDDVRRLDPDALARWYRGRRRDRGARLRSRRRFGARDTHRKGRRGRDRSRSDRRGRQPRHRPEALQRRHAGRRLLDGDRWTTSARQASPTASWSRSRARRSGPTARWSQRESIARITTSTAAAATTARSKAW